MSGGRLILGIGAGWYDEEYASYGFRFPPASERLAILDETLQAIRRLWTEETVTFDGEHVHFDGAYCDPKPLQQLPAVWVGGGGERKTLRIAARHADATNWQVGIEDFVRKSELLEQHCEEVGRPFDEITRTHGPDCRIFDTDAETRAWCAEPDGGSLWGRTPADEYLRENLVGTVEQVTEKTQAFVDAGCKEFVLWMRDYPSDESVRRFIGEVVPNLEVNSAMSPKYDAMLAETVMITGHGGDEIAAYLARPMNPGPTPGVLVIHHMPGWDEGIEGDHPQVRRQRILGDLPSPALPRRPGREPRRRCSCRSSSRRST